MISKIDILEFLEAAKTLPVLDARSELEFAHACFPGAINLPLLNNEERTIVGTTYKKEGNEAAVIKGYELVGHKFANYVKQALEIAPQKTILIYCWRGGLRSNIMAFVLHSAGFNVKLLTGGYKRFRNWALETLSVPKSIKIVGGKTGTGKTYILHELTKMGEQVIDLEGLAHHKGSAFGSLGEKPQPSVEHFENKLALQWDVIDADKTLWLENESRLIGTVRIPTLIYEAMRSAITIDIQIPLQERINNIMHDYGHFDKQLLEAGTRKLEKKLGNLRLQQAVDLLHQNELEAWIFILLEYYDKAYLYGKEQRSVDLVKSMVCEGLSAQEIAVQLLQYKQ